MRRLFSTIILFTVLACTTAKAQVGEYRNVFSVGVSAGYAMDNVGFQPTVTQKMHGGMSLGITGRYTSEKYFSTLCAIQAELNLVQGGWTEDILTINNTPVINPETGVAEQYKRHTTYLQLPIFAHLSWGKEKEGVCGFVNLGPQIGMLIGESTSKNYYTPFTKNNFPDIYTQATGRISQHVEQEGLAVENKFDYGITFGAGVEVDIKKIGRFSIEGRYYYGLGNIYGDSKRDYFGKSNHGIIFANVGYMRTL